MKKLIRLLMVLNQPDIACLVGSGPVENVCPLDFLMSGTVIRLSSNEQFRKTEVIYQQYRGKTESLQPVSLY